MANNILFIFEGEKPEKSLIENISNHFLAERTKLVSVFCADIYELYSKVSQDEYLDTFNLLKERDPNKELLAPFTRDDFAEIYLFFDYDGHATQADDAKIEALLELFNEETESGKLYISYPMVEAIRHLSGDGGDFRNLKVAAKRNIRYKKMVNDEGNSELQSLFRLTYEHWRFLLEQHLKKMNLIVNDDFVLPVGYIPQTAVFQSQLEKYINVDNTVAVLSPFPIFLIDYFGGTAIREIIEGE